MESAVLERWRLGAELGARGLYGQAEAIASELFADSEVESKALGRALVASHRRQLGDYPCALHHDDKGLAAWETAGLPVDWPYVDLLVNRAADAVGLKDLADAEEWLARADQHSEHGDERTAVRAGWVRAALSLARDEAEGAMQVIDELALPLARMRSKRHATKSRLLRAVVLHRLGESEQARAELDRVLVEAMQGTWHPLMWSAALWRGRLEADAAERERYFEIARTIIELIGLDLHPSRASAFGRALPPELRTPD